MSVFVLSSCLTVGPLEKLDNNTLLSYNCKNIPKCCEHYAIFTNVSFSSKSYDPNFIIGKAVENILTKPIHLEKLPNYLKAKSPILEYLQEGIINYYVIDKTTAKVSLYSFVLEIDKDKLDHMASATFNYSKAIDFAVSYKRKAAIAAQPFIEKSRRVPYTDYMAVSKPVTRFRYNYFTRQNESYTEYERFQEPYVNYRIENYMVPNSDYDPALAAQHTEDSTCWQEEAIRIEREADQINWYSLYFNEKASEE